MVLDSEVREEKEEDDSIMLQAKGLEVAFILMDFKAMMAEELWEELEREDFAEMWNKFMGPAAAEHTQENRDTWMGVDSQARRRNWTSKSSRVWTGSTKKVRRGKALFSAKLNQPLLKFLHKHEDQCPRHGEMEGMHELSLQSCRAICIVMFDSAWEVTMRETQDSTGTCFRCCKTTCQGTVRSIENQKPRSSNNLQSRMHFIQASYLGLHKYNILFHSQRL